MPKKRSKISKKVTFSNDDLLLPKENEQIGVVEKMLGGDRLLVFVGDEEHIVRIPGRYKGQLLLRRGSYLLLGQSIEGCDDNLNILHKYDADEVDALVDKGLLEE